MQYIQQIIRDTLHPHARWAQLHKAELLASLACFHIGAVVSGGQTGTDRAAFDFATRQRIPCCGFAPQGKKDELGTIPKGIADLLREPDGNYYTGNQDLFAERTELNARFSDATLIISPVKLDKGTQFTLDMAKRFDRPLHQISIESTDLTAEKGRFREFLKEHKPVLLNIAGPRQSSHDHLDVYGRSLAILEAIF